VSQSIKGLKNPATAYLLATIVAFVLYHLDRKYDIVCSMIYKYQHPKCMNNDYAQYQRGYRDKLHREFDAYVPPEQGESWYPFGISSGFYMFLLSVSIMCLIFALKKVL